MKNTPTNYDECIDSRDIVERIEELQGEREDLVDTLEDALEDYTLDDADDIIGAFDDLTDWDESEEAKELAILESLQDECEGYSDWVYGETLVRYSYWVCYVQDLLEDIGDLPRDLPHYIAIDWEATARNIAADYSLVDFDGIEYYIRSC